MKRYYKEQRKFVQRAMERYCNEQWDVITKNNGTLLQRTMGGLLERTMEDCYKEQWNVLSFLLKKLNTVAVPCFSIRIRPIV